MKRKRKLAFGDYLVFKPIGFNRCARAGLRLSEHKLIGVYSRVFTQRHDITIAYLCKCKPGRVVLNNEHSEYRLFKKVPAGLDAYLLETIRDSNWKKR